MLRLKLRKAGLSYSKSISNKRRRNSNLAFIALGSNKGERISYLRKAVSNLRNNSKIDLTTSSSVYETKPYGNLKQTNFLNAVIQIKTSFSLAKLFEYLKQLEFKLGREETTKWGPREIDLDILFFNDTIIKDQNLTVPHYGIQDRDFVLVPLNEIAPDLFHPVLKQKISDICTEDISKNIIRKTRLKIN